MGTLLLHSSFQKRVLQNRKLPGTQEPSSRISLPALHFLAHYTTQTEAGSAQKQPSNPKPSCWSTLEPLFKAQRRAPERTPGLLLKPPGCAGGRGAAEARPWRRLPSPRGTTEKEEEEKPQFRAALPLPGGHPQPAPGLWGGPGGSAVRRGPATAPTPAPQGGRPRPGRLPPAIGAPPVARSPARGRSPPCLLPTAAASRAPRSQPKLASPGAARAPCRPGGGRALINAWLINAWLINAGLPAEGRPRLFLLSQA